MQEAPPHSTAQHPSDDLFRCVPEEMCDACERPALLRLMRLLLALPPPPDPVGLFPRYEELHVQFTRAVECHDGDAIEEAFLSLYAHLHGFEAPYTPVERRQLNAAGGYWCHAGGVSPILKAGPHLSPTTVSADFGAGNGLQCLLMQSLFPHQKTVQIELSSRMVEAGQALQTWLGLGRERVEWVVGDVLDYAPCEFDFIYLYRPVRPEGQGRAFYKKFASMLAEQNKPICIFSIADCLREFLPASFEVFYTDGHLTCFRRTKAGTTVG